MFAGVRRGVRDTRIGARSLNKRALLLIKTGIFFSEMVFGEVFLLARASANATD